MPRRSAGLLLYRRAPGGPRVLIAHMGGPFWARREEGAWSIPKGERPEGEDPLATARREFEEELGAPPPPGEPVELGEYRQSGGKRVMVFAQEGDFDASSIASNEVEVEWPPRSGRRVRFPEVDRAEWTDLATARARLVRGQVPALDDLARLVEGAAASP
jgi:predicted NUDIX family NTP pyrophosphohydrolase